jgi:hypothetical protein
MPKLNGILLPIGLVSVLGVSIFTWGANSNQIANTKEAVSEVKETHEADVKSIDGKLETLIDNSINQSVNIGKIQQSVEYMREDIQAIKQAQ